MEIIKFNENNNYAILIDKIKIDLEKSIPLVRLKKYRASNFRFNDDDNLWYFNNFKTDRKLINIIFPEKENYEIKFINNDYNDYRSSNIIFTEDKKFIDNFIDPPGYEILEKGNSHLIKEGTCAGEYRNMYWKVKKDNLTYYLMHIKDDLYTKISKRDIKKVLFFKDKRPTWRLFQNGYVTCTINIADKQKVYYLHQLILDVHDEDLTSFEKTVDHINCDKLDNRRDNLRLVNMSVQNANRGKSARRCDANELPDNLTQKDLPKYIIYRKEILDKETNRYREYFYIQNHPKLEKTWETTKSNKVSIREKLKLAKLKLEYLDEIISEAQYNQQSGSNKQIEKEQELKLPKYFRLSNDRNRKQFIYDQKVNDKRQTLRMVLQSDNEEKELEKFIELVKEKYQ
jgi:hypothetical protein